MPTYIFTAILNITTSLLYCYVQLKGQTISITWVQKPRAGLLKIQRSHQLNYSTTVQPQCTATDSNQYLSTEAQGRLLENMQRNHSVMNRIGSTPWKMITLYIMPNLYYCEPYKSVVHNERVQNNVIPPPGHKGCSRRIKSSEYVSLFSSFVRGLVYITNS